MEYAIKNNGIYESIPFYSLAVQTKGRTNITLKANINNESYAKCKTIRDTNTVTKLDYPLGTTLKLTSRLPFSYTIPGLIPRYSNKHKIEDYLYEITYGNIDYDYAYTHLKDTMIGGCSSIRNGRRFGRNFDWQYDNQVQFIVHTPSSLDRYAVLGVSGIVPGITKSTVDQDNIIVEGVDMFKLLPFYLLDGINEKGVFCTQNLTPLDDEISPTTEVIAQIEERDRVSAVMLTRFILDKFSSADQAIQYLKNYTTIYFNGEVFDSGYRSHFMLGDIYSTYIIEFIDGEMKIIDHKYITNFNIAGVEFNKDKTIKYPAMESGIYPYGFGLERWDIIAKNYNTSNTLSGMRALLDKLKFSNCYNEDDFWYSELVTQTDDEGHSITVDTDPNVCTTAKAAFIEAYEDRDRDNPETWITCHSSIYDIYSKKLYITNQESTTEYVFKLQ